MDLFFVGQPRDGSVIDHLADLASSGDYGHVDVAIAYATVGGVIELCRAMPPAFESIAKRWLVGIDWCRSDPDALAMLSKLKNSQVRVHNGASLVLKPGCYPDRPFHPKGFIFWSKSKIALAFGSANLSRNGMTRGHEADLFLQVTHTKANTKSQWAECTGAKAWFEDLWAKASRLSKVEADYRRRFKAAPKQSRPAPTEDDTASSARVNRAHSFSSEDLVKLRACDSFWVQAGNLHKNRGPALPGNQLMLRALTRVFFEFPADDVPTDTLVGIVAIDLEGTVWSDRTLRFSNNSMDVLALPTENGGQPVSYDGESLLFERIPLAGTVQYRLSFGTRADEARWKRASDAIGSTFSMTSGRRFGAF
jgi:hypothetical protein